MPRSSQISGRSQANQYPYILGAMEMGYYSFGRVTEGVVSDMPAFIYTSRHQYNFGLNENNNLIYITNHKINGEFGYGFYGRNIVTNGTIFRAELPAEMPWTPIAPKNGLPLPVFDEVTSF